MSNQFREWLGCALIAGCLSAACGVQTCQAQRPDDAGEIKERIARMMREAEELQHVGRAEAAERVLAEAAELRARLERRIGGADVRRERLLAQVKGAVGALHELGRPDDAEQLAHTLESLVRPEREGDRPERKENPEIRAARRQLEVLHVAMEALASAGRGDAAHQLERAIHARRLAIEGRRGEEAMAVRRSAPSTGAQADLLAMAARILEERGQPDRAHVAAEMAATLAGREAPPRERAEPDEERRLASEERLELLEARLREVTNAVEQLHAELRELRQAR